ncbi:MAG: hypothetical protein M1308_01340 [Actinobacteria bacterium]|nr:hypothetical protein [Actinomycetota bacterium]
MAFFILFAGIVLSAAVRLFFIVNSLDVADVLKTHQVAQTILQGHNPYQSLWFAMYPPLNYYLEAATLYFSNLSSIPFHMLTKLWPNLADIAIGLILYKFLLQQNVKPIFASFWSLVFLLNPISIIISSAHGQVDSIPSMLVVLSVYFLTTKPVKPYFLWSALFLGLGIAIKPNPLMLLPLFILCLKSSVKQKIIFALVSITPIAVSVIPFLLQGTYQVITKVFNYSGVYDFGYMAVLRGLWFQQNANIWIPVSNELALTSKIIFLLGLIVLTLLFSKSRNLVKGILAIYLLFLGFYFGISAQYLSWILPFAVLERYKMTFLFSLTGIIALLGFYMFFGPDILLGKLSIISAFQSKYMPIYVIGNLALWITVVWWLIKITIDEICKVKSARKFRG